MQNQVSCFRDTRRDNRILTKTDNKKSNLRAEQIRSICKNPETDGTITESLETTWEKETLVIQESGLDRDAGWQ